MAFSWELGRLLAQVSTERIELQKLVAVRVLHLQRLLPLLFGLPTSPCLRNFPMTEGLPKIW
jgi:hypothetical protein